MKCLESLLNLDSAWIPHQEGNALYIRLTMIGTGTAIGVHEPKDALLYVICSPCHPYYNNELSLLVTEEYTRSYYNGTGEFKIGPNYSPCLLYQKEAKLRGFDQNL